MDILRTRILMSFLAHLPLTLPGSDGPRTMDVDDDVPVEFIQLVQRALRLTRNAQGWPTSFKRPQPILVLTQGLFADSTGLIEGGSDPVRMTSSPATVRIGDQILNSGVLPGLCRRGFTDEQLIVLVLAHEAYHSNEAQRLQRCSISMKAFRSGHLFAQAAHPDFPAPVLRIIERLSLIQPQNSRDNFRLKRLHSKVLEGAADVHSLMIFKRLFPNDGLRMAQALSIERQVAWKTSRHRGMVGVLTAYDNADCILRLLDLPLSKWPDDASSCARFSWDQALPLLRHARVFQNHQADLDVLTQYFQPAGRMPVRLRDDLLRLRSLEQEMVSPVPRPQSKR